jgi:hypothetical protein
VRADLNLQRDIAFNHPLKTHRHAEAQPQSVRHFRARCDQESTMLWRTPGNTAGHHNQAGRYARHHAGKELGFRLGEGQR